MKTTMTLLAGLALTAVAAMADSNVYRSIIGDAANIEQDAHGISHDLKSKNFDAARVKSEIEALGKDIAKLKKDVEDFDSKAAELTGAKKADWEMVKTKAQLLLILYDRKAELLMEDPAKNRAVVRSLAAGIAQRADMLQKTAGRLDR
jgi:septal ring factor EnvC (AmiA/AmiB activator)